MSRKEKASERSETEVEASAPFGMLLLSWLAPGLGHLMLGKTRRAAVFAGIVVAAFVTGLLLSGELAAPQRGNPFSYLATIGCLGNGLLYIVAKLAGLGHGDPLAPGFNFGNTFLYTAGLMNLLLILDVADISVGRKE